jgi:translation initiation factor 3 subunit D
LLADQINLNQVVMWGVLQQIVRTIRAEADGKYLLHKDPNTPVLMIYSVPMDAFEDEFESDSGSDEEDDEDGEDDADGAAEGGGDAKEDDSEGADE